MGESGLNMKKEALIVHLSGGLGNQLFQISTGISLGQITGRSLIINNNLYKNPLIRGRINSNYQKKRKFEANNFKSVASISLDKSLTPINGSFERLVSRLGSSQRKLLGIATEENFSEGGWKNAAEVRRLVGHFTSPKFFKDIDVKEIFSELNHELSDWSINTINRIQQGNLPCIHVRLGDYLHQDNIVVPKEKYYRDGVDIINRLLDPKHKALLFSDQPELISTYFPKLAQDTEIVRPPSNLGPAEILYVMSKCSGFVCSNSTFSWWASRLSNVKPEYVVAPRVYQTYTQQLDSLNDFWPERAKLID